MPELVARAEEPLPAVFLIDFERLRGGDALVLTLARQPRSAAFSATGPRAQQLLEALAKTLVG